MSGAMATAYRGRGAAVNGDVVGSSLSNMKTVRALVMVSLVVAVAGCGSNSSQPAARETSTTTVPKSTTTTGEHDTEHGKEHGPDHHAPAPKPAKPLPVLPDGTLDPDGVDLSGIEGVTAEQQKYAEKLLVDTINILPVGSSYEEALANGFVTVGDESTGEEHLIRWDRMNDDVYLNPSEPESLVYQVDQTGGRTLEAAMFFMPDRFTLDNVPMAAGKLMQFHVHDDLCFLPPPSGRLAGFRVIGEPCAEGTNGLPNLMAHVWIRPNACGPFAALTGVGGGQVKEGEEVSCLAEHGSHGL